MIYKRHMRKAFTLVELLVVMSILAILVSLLMPSFSKAKVMVRRTACRTNLHAIAAAMRMYLNDSKDVLPLAAQMPSLKLNNDPPISEVLRPYVTQQAVFCCPADKDKLYYRQEGSSYEYQSMLGGQKVENSFFTKRFGESKTVVMNDYIPFHGPRGRLGSANFLFADDHVGDLE